MEEQTAKRWKIKELTAKLWGSDLKIRIIVIIGILGIAFIFLSGLFDSGKGTADAGAVKEIPTEEYVEKLEKRIHSIVTNIDGVGTAKVMITLENTVEYVYESEKKETTDLSKDYQDGETEKEQARNDYERSVILVDGKNGREALLKTTVEPKVKGVVVVCRGGENVAVEKRVVDAVTTALAISSNRVCVAKLSE